MQHHEILSYNTLHVFLKKKTLDFGKFFSSNQLRECRRKMLVYIFIKAHFLGSKVFVPTNSADHGSAACSEFYQDK